MNEKVYVFLNGYGKFSLFLNEKTNLENAASGAKGREFESRRAHH